MTETLTTSQLMTPLYASASMRAIMSDRARLQRMLDFEAALARAEAAVGVITATSAAAIGDACDAALYDIVSLVEAQAPSGNITVAVVDALTQQVATRDQAAANFVHGAPPARMSSTPRWCLNSAPRSMRWSPIWTPQSRASPRWPDAIGARFRSRAL